MQSMIPFLSDTVRGTGKITGPRIIGHSDRLKYEFTCSVKLKKCPMYDAYLLDRAKDIRQKSMDHEIVTDS